MKNKHNLPKGIYWHLQQSIDILNQRIHTKESQEVAKVLDKFLNGGSG